MAGFMGDDLVFAQKFTAIAADGLGCLVEMPDPRDAQSAPVVTAMMTQIQSGAKRLRARHIYQSAQSVLRALHHEPDAILQERISSLGHLVTHYAEGLEELIRTPTTVTMPAAVNRTDRWSNARTELDALIVHAAPDDADALSRLMRAPVTLDEIGHDAPAQSAPADILNFPTSPAQAVASLSMPLDSLMRDIVQDALSVARSVGRTISVSYDMGDTHISEEISEDLRRRVGQALSQIIRQALPEDRVGHIDINIAHDQLHIVAGAAAVRVAVDPAAVPAAAAKPRHMITPETETGLRAQLAALMEPSASPLDGTAS